MTETRALSQPEMAAWHAFLHGHAAVIRKLEAELAACHGLSLPAYEVLAHLSEAPDRRMRMSDLTRRALLTPSGVTRLVDKLERDGLVCRRRCAEDARAIYAVLTDAGMTRLVAAYPTHLRGVRRHLVNRLRPDELPGLADALHRLVDEPDGC